MSEVWRKLVSNGWVQAVFRTWTIFSLRLNTWILTRFWLRLLMFKPTSHTCTTKLDHSVYVGLPNLYWTRVKCLGKINFNLHSKMALLTWQCHNNLSRSLDVPLFQLNAQIQQAQRCGAAANQKRRNNSTVSNWNGEVEDGSWRDGAYLQLQSGFLSSSNSALVLPSTLISA